MKTSNCCQNLILKERAKGQPDEIHHKWALKGSYRLEYMLVTIRNLKNRSSFSHTGYAIYDLDDYSVHLIPDVRKALWEREYILVIIDGGIYSS